ncbi:lipase family protein [Mycolicibacillus trivialis]|uniref:Lipase n=1 Tax=Mycolicibacillus trivialis TaxID=1798 RepID=A0A1X2EPW6_9MYCO|nr:lipase [Mycolicibacillus trivialis]
MMELGSAATAGKPEWIGQPPHEELPSPRSKDAPPLPTDDPFYLPPAGYEHSRPGTVLRSRDVQPAFLGRIPVRATAIQLLYRTQDMNGEPEASVTTVLVPADRAPGATHPLLSYQCAIDALTSRCFPSYALRRGAKALGSLAQLEFLLIGAALAEGWTVSVPDHEGLSGLWGSPYEPGYRVLDGLRAALSCERLALPADAPIGLWGYSGGGLASAWAAELCGQYAPELEIAGAVLGSPVGDLGHTFRRLNGTLFAALPALVIAALSHRYPGLREVIDEHATEDGHRLLRSLESMTTIGALLRLHGTDMDDYIDWPLEQVLSLPAVQHVFHHTRLGVQTPAPPVLLVQAVHDPIIGVDDIDTLADTYRAGGAHVTYHRDAFCEHLLLHPLSAPMSLRWLTDRFAGRPHDERRERTRWPALFNPATYQGMARLAVVSAQLLTGRAVRRRPL